MIHRLLVALSIGLSVLVSPALAADQPSTAAPPALAETYLRQMWEGRVPEAYAAFDDGMRAASSVAKLEELVASERGDRGAIRTVSDVKAEQKGSLTVVHLVARFEKGRPLRFTISMRNNGRVAGLYFVPASGQVSEQDLHEAIAAIPGQVGIAALVAERPEVAFRYQANLLFSTGSQFKVLVLARTAELVTGGKLKLDQRLEISPRTRSFPSGVLQDFDPGLKPTVNDLLSHMISISDNTATDTLLLSIGRESIIDRLEPWGFKSQPAMLTTAEMFGLSAGLGGLPADPGLRRSTLATFDHATLYRAGGKALDEMAHDRTASGTRLEEYYERVPYEDRKALSHVLDWRIPAEELADFYRRVATDRFESPGTSQLVAKYLHKGGAGIIGAYLASDPRVQSIARKGGSDQGILTDGGFITTKDGRHIVIVVMTNDLPSGATDKVVIPKLSNLSQLLFDYLEGPAKR